MMIVVTGGNGRIGRYVARALLANGHGVRAVDRVLAPDRDCPQMLVDLTDLGQVFGALHGADAVLHLAAIPDPGGHPDEVVFGNNVLATFNVVQAAEGSASGGWRGPPVSAPSASPITPRARRPSTCPSTRSIRCYPQTAMGCPSLWARRSAARPRAARRSPR